MTRRTRLVIGALASLAIMIVGVVVLPTRTWFSQQRDLTSTRAEIAQVKRQNVELQKQVDRLGDDAAVELQARRDLGMVYPGEESYTITAPAAPTVNLPAVWPFDLLQDPIAQAVRQQAK